MVVFRCTQKLAKRFNLHLEKDCAETSTYVLGDWYFNYFTHQRKYYLLGLSENSLLPVIVPAKEIKDYPMRFCSELGKILVIIGIDKQRRMRKSLRCGRFGLQELKAKKFSALKTIV